MRQLKPTWSLIWILIGFVVLAVVDRVPDPPSSKPDSVKCSVSSSQELPVAFDTTANVSIIAVSQSEQATAFVPFAPVLPDTRIPHLERATDPSPPAFLS